MISPYHPEDDQEAYYAAMEKEDRMRKINKDMCPECNGDLDTGWECNRCGFDAQLELLSAMWNNAMMPAKFWEPRFRLAQKEFDRLKSTPSDINQHLDVLFDIARFSRRITEFGVRSGVSTWALLTGLLARAANGDGEGLLSSYDIRNCDVSHHRAVGGSLFVFDVQDSLQAEIAETEVLFIDTLHTRAQLLAELNRHAPKVTRTIILHDTTTFGDVSEDGRADGGLMGAVTEFLAQKTGFEGSKWVPSRRYENNNGLLILSRTSASI